MLRPLISPETAVAYTVNIYFSWSEMQHLEEFPAVLKHDSEVKPLYLNS